MRIAIITSGILPVPAVQGGAVENLVDFLLEYNNKKRLHNITIYSIYNKKVKNHPALLSDVNQYVFINNKSLSYKIGEKLYSIYGRSSYYPHQLMYFIKQVWNNIRKNKYSFDLIILENRPGFTLALKNKTQTPIISHIHTNTLYEQTPQNIDIINHSHRFIVVSEFIKNEIQKIDKRADIRVVYNGLDTNKFHKGLTSNICRDTFALKDDDFVVIFWGRLVPKKGIKELLLAINKLKDYSEIKLLVIGSINYEDTNEQTNTFIQELKTIADSISGKVIFTGYISYEVIPHYLSLANVAVIPSRINDALNMSCLEACAMGLPIIATNDGGIPETLIGQKHILIENDEMLSDNLASAIINVKEHYSSYLGNKLSSTFTKESFVNAFFENIKD